LNALKWVRRIGLPLVLCAALAILAWQLQPHYPLEKWLFWRYLGSWLWASLFTLGALSSGLAILEKLCPGSLRLDERIVIAFSLGVVVAFTGIFVGGLLHLFGGGFFVVFPLLMIAAGARSTWRLLRRAHRHLRHARKTAAPAPRWAPFVIGLGVAGLLLVYIPILTPENASFDSRWQHLGIAEHYAVARGIERFPEGWFVGTSPHLAAVLYAWAFQLPGSMLFDRVELAAHLELVCFLFTLGGIPALVRRLVPKTRARLSWVLRFAFPGIFVYDSTLSIGADHIAAIFAVPVFLVLLRAHRELSPRWMALLGTLIAGALMTKYTGALLLVGFPLLAIAIRGLWLGALAIRKRAPPLRVWVAGLGLFAGAIVVITSMHWLKNWIWYGDPAYPILHRVFSPHPWTPDAAERFQIGFVEKELWRPERNLSGVWASLKMLVTFSFIPNDWPQFHGKIPVFGSLFTLSLAALPFLQKTRRIWALVAATHVGMLAWYWTHHQDRYLQAAVPWMTAVTAAVVIGIFRSGVVPRIFAILLIALQGAWGLSLCLIEAHTIVDSPYKATMSLLLAGYKKEYDKRLKPYGGFYDVGTLLDKDDKLLMHDQRQRLGIRARGVSDLPNNQGGISYGYLDSPGAVYDLLKGYGVTHLAWSTSNWRGADSLASELMFQHFAERFTLDRKPVGGLTLGRMPDARPAAPGIELVALFTCNKTYKSGLYPLSGLRGRWFEKAPPPEPSVAAPASPAPATELLAQAGAVVTEPKCPRTIDMKAFTKVTQSKQYDLWLKR
jgi:hypothetical protein